MDYKKLTIFALALGAFPAFAQEVVMEEVVVLGQFVPDEKRDTSEISNVLDAEALSLLADSNVGDALSRVTGLSLVGGKYVYVRGLGERYSSTLLDGSRISSPVPFQKTVPLDIVPKSIVDNLLVQKTYSAQYPGDFSGGLVDIRTRSTPDETYVRVEAGIAGHSETTGGDGLTYRGGSWDNWGYDDGTRQQPTNVAALTSEQFEDTEFPQDLGLGASFFNFWDITQQEMKPNYSGEIEIGWVHEFDSGLKIGFLGAGGYSNDWTNRFNVMRRYEFTGVDGGSNQTVDYERNTTQQTVNLSGFYNVGLEYNDHAVTLSYVILRQTEDVLQQLRGLSSEDNIANGVQVQSYRLQWTENEIDSVNLNGEHYFNIGDAVEGGVLNWRVADGGGERSSPDRRSYTYAENRDGNFGMVIPSQQAAGDLREVFQAPDRNYSELVDDISEYGFDVEIPFYVGDGELSLKAGYSTYERERESEDRLFRFDVDSGAPDFVILGTPAQFFSIENWQRGYLSVRDFSASAANASGIFPFAQASEETDGGYIAIDYQVTPRIRVQAGVRSEDVTLSADAWGGNTLPGTSNLVSRDFSDTLPSGSVTWEFINDMQVRLAYSETVNRPSLLEITGSTIRNPENYELYRGNVFLEPATLENLDLRWEWYFGFSDSATIGIFAKDFENPIEIGKVQAQNDIFTWFNAEEAELSGVELELNKALTFSEWFDWHMNWDFFKVTANVSLIDSEVTLLGAGETASAVPLTGSRQLSRLFTNVRPITGQSDVLGNLILTYSNLDMGLEGSLAYNYTGERNVLVGDLNSPNIVEEGRGKVDLLLKYFVNVGDNEVEVEFKVQNLTNEQYEWTQGALLYEQWDPGISYSLTLKASVY